MYINTKRKMGSVRFMALPLAMLVLIQAFFSVPLAAQSSGPSQPEFEQVQVVGASNFVDPFTGNFQYSIPLFDIGGLPITLSYSSDHKMDDEASWVGFGWTLNPSTISRQVRGVPDDFNGDEITHIGNMEPSVTTSIVPGGDLEVFGTFGLGLNTNFSYNNQTGFSFSSNLSPSVDVTKLIQGDVFEEPATEGKFRVLPDILLNNFSASLSANINSREGLESLSYGASMNRYLGVKGAFQFGGFTYTPAGDFPRTFTSTSRYVKIGVNAWPVSAHNTIQSQRTEQSYQQNRLLNSAYGYLYLNEGKGNRDAVLDYNVERSGILPQNSPRLSMPFGTPDVFSVSGAGIAGQLQICRNDISVFHPTYVESNSSTSGGGGDLAFGGNVHLGANVSNTVILNKKGGLPSEGNAVDSLQSTGGDPKKGEVYFSFTNALNARFNDGDSERFAQTGATVPAYVPIEKQGAGVVGKSQFVEKDIESLDVSETLGSFRDWASDEPQIRENQVTYLTNLEGGAAFF